MSAPSRRPTPAITASSVFPVSRSAARMRAIIDSAARPSPSPRRTSRLARSSPSPASPSGPGPMTARRPVRRIIPPSPSSASSTGSPCASRAAPVPTRMPMSPMPPESCPRNPVRPRAIPCRTAPRVSRRTTCSARAPSRPPRPVSSRRDRSLPSPDCAPLTRSTIAPSPPSWTPPPRPSTGCWQARPSTSRVRRPSSRMPTPASAKPSPSARWSSTRVIMSWPATSWSRPSPPRSCPPPSRPSADSPESIASTTARRPPA